jgi:hypothetical protein
MESQSQGQISFFFFFDEPEPLADPHADQERLRQKMPPRGLDPRAEKLKDIRNLPSRIHTNEFEICEQRQASRRNRRIPTGAEYEDEDGLLPPPNNKIH